MMLALLLALSTLASAELPPEVSALADAPLDGKARVAHARTLLARRGWEEAGIEALRLLAADPVAGTEARAVLAAFLAPIDGRPGWARVYADLLTDPALPSRDLVALRQAEALALVATSRGRGLAALDTLASSSSPPLQRALGRAFLRVGEADRALAAYGRAAGQEGQADGQLLAAIAAGRLDVAREVLAVTGKPGPPGVTEALDLATPVARAEALASSGYLVMAARILSAAPESAAVLRLAEIYRAQGRPADAVAVLTRLRRQTGGSEALDRSLADAYQSLRRYREALGLEVDDEARDQQLQAASRFKAAWESRSKADDVPALEEAWRVWPGEPFVAREWGKYMLQQSRPAEALPALGTVLDIDPVELDALGVYSLAALASGTPSSAARRYLAAAAATTDPGVRASSLRSAASFLALHAEDQKQRALVDDALDAYLASLAMAPASRDASLGAAGLLWQSQRYAGALALYEAQRASSPDDPQLLMACVRLHVQLGQEEAALAILASTRSTDKQVALLRVTIENAIRAREARAAQRAGDVELAAALWRQLVETWPEEPEFLHGLGDALAALGQCEEAVEAYRETTRLDPAEPWAVLGEANCLVRLGRSDEARARVAAGYPSGIDLVADQERPRVVAAAWRHTAGLLHQDGHRRQAFEAWREAFLLHPEVWSLTGLGGLYMEHDQPEVALAFYQEADELGGGELAPRVGMALALEQLGRWDEALAAAGWMVQGSEVPADAVEARRKVVRRVTVAQAEHQRRSGDPGGALARVRAVIEAEGPSADLWNAQVAAALDVRDCGLALAGASAALSAGPTSTWSLTMAVRAGSVCRAMPQLYAEIDAATRVAGTAAAESLGRGARLELLVQRGERLAEAGRVAEAVTPLKEAEALPPSSADEWSRLGGAWLATGQAARAVSAFGRALALDPAHVPATIGIAGALRAQMRLAAAEAHLQAAYDARADPRVGLQLVQVLIQRGRYARAEVVLADVKTRSLPPEPPPPAPPEPLDPLPVLPLPSERVPGPRTWPPTPPQDTQPRWLVDAREAIDIALLRERSVNVVTAGGIFNRPGEPGSGALTGWYLPVSAILPPVGLLRFDVDATVVSLTDGVDDDLGVAASAGVASPPFRRLFGTARVGVSPVGFEDVNVLWSAHLRYGLTPSLSVGGTFARAPVADSLLSWAGKVDSARGLHGFVSQVWGSAYLNWTPSTPVDAGLLLRGGYTEGYGVEPNPVAEAVAWAGYTAGRREGRAFARLGAEALAQSHARQEDGFDVGQGGYFSPPLFLLGGLTVDAGAFLAGRNARVCGLASAGPQYTDGEPTPWFGVGLTGAGKVGLGVAVRLSPGFSVGVDGRYQATLGGWHQETALAHLTWGLVPASPAAPSQTTVASPGAALLSTADLCRVQ